MTLRRTREAMENLMPEATTGELGGVQRATNSESDARVDTEKYVTPAHLPEPSSVPNASTTTRGYSKNCDTSRSECSNR